MGSIRSNTHWRQQMCHWQLPLKQTSEYRLVDHLSAHTSRCMVRCCSRTEDQSSHYKLATSTLQGAVLCLCTLALWCVGPDSLHCLLATLSSLVHTLLGAVCCLVNGPLHIISTVGGLVGSILGNTLGRSCTTKQQSRNCLASAHRIHSIPASCMLKGWHLANLTAKFT